MKPRLKAPGTKRLKLKNVKLLSSFAFNFKLRRYMTVDRPVIMRHLLGDQTDPFNRLPLSVRPL
jgi:hypothetical protein